MSKSLRFAIRTKPNSRRPEGTAGNIEGAEAPLDFTGIGLYDDFDKMLAEANLDAVSVTLPTYMHREFTRQSANMPACNVLCEKPMALDRRGRPGDARRRRDRAANCSRSVTASGSGPSMPRPRS